MEDRRKQILQGIAGGVAVVAVIAALALDVGRGPAVKTDSRPPVELVIPDKDDPGTSAGVGTSPGRSTSSAPATSGPATGGSNGSAPAEEPDETPDPDPGQDPGNGEDPDPDPGHDPGNGGGGGGGSYPHGNRHTYEMGDQKLAHDEGGGSGGQPTPPPPGHGEGAYDTCRAKKAQHAC